MRRGRGWSVGRANGSLRKMPAHDDLRHGRAMASPGFAGDDGSADPRLRAALDAIADKPARHPDVLFALASARVLVPVVAVHPASGQRSGRRDGAAPAPAASMALVTVLGRDGRAALPVFTSIATLAEWRADARPVPVPAQRAALSAYAEQAPVLLVDPAGPVPFVVEGEALRALAQGGVRRPLYADEEAAALLAQATTDLVGLAAARFEPAAGADARVILTVTGKNFGTQAAERVAQRLRDSASLRPRILLGLELAVEFS